MVVMDKRFQKLVIVYVDRRDAHLEFCSGYCWCYCYSSMDTDDLSNNLSRMGKEMSMKMPVDDNECDEKDNDQTCQFSSCWRRFLCKGFHGQI